MRNDLVVRPFKTHHVIPSQVCFVKQIWPSYWFLKCDLFPDLVQGYVIYSVRKKLKKKYLHLKGTQIQKLKLSGVEVCDLHFLWQSWHTINIKGHHIDVFVFLRAISSFFFLWYFFEFGVLSLLDYRHYIVSWGGLYRRHNVWLSTWAKECRCIESESSYNRGNIILPVYDCFLIELCVFFCYCFFLDFILHLVCWQRVFSEPKLLRT